jgi:hypothetical protein
MIQAFHSAVARKKVAGGGNGFLTGLLNWWNLNETSGNAVASAGGVDLTDLNTVTYTAGGAPDGGNARLFTAANQEAFSGSGLLGSGTNITLAIWFKSAAPTVGRYILGHDAPNGFTHIRNLVTSGYLNVQFDAAVSRQYASNIGTGWHSLVATSTGPGGSDTAYIDGTLITDTATDRGWEPGTATYYLGAAHTGATATRWDGNLTSHGIWSRVFTSDDATAWHNSGVNLRYADLTS